MRKLAKTAPAAIFGLGVGAAVGPSLGSAAIWSGLGISALGVTLFLFGTTESDLVVRGSVERDDDAGLAGGGATEATAVAAGRGRNRHRPTLSGLGSRVDQILELAEEQSEKHRERARLEADGIVSAAQREAEEILNRAHEQASGTTGTRRDPSPSLPTQAPSSDEDRSPNA